MNQPMNQTMSQSMKHGLILNGASKLKLKTASRPEVPKEHHPTSSLVQHRVSGRTQLIYGTR